MSKTEELKQKYVKDADAMATKSRFGFFTLPPSHTAAHTDNPSNPPPRDQDGRVVTQPPNIYSGTTSNPHLQKNFFSYIPSPFHGSTYEDPGKNERREQLQQQKKQEGKEIFRPVKLNKSLMSSSYPYMNHSDPSKDKKNYRDADGKVIVQSPNMLVSPQSKITYNSNKNFKYTECPPPEKTRTESAQQSQEAFRTGVPPKHLFNSNIQTYFDTNLKKTETQKSLPRTASHEGPFKPSCISKGLPFTPLVHKEEGPQTPKKIEKKENKGDPFKLTKVEKNSRPSPSIALTKVNVLRICR